MKPTLPSLAFTTLVLFASSAADGAVVQSLDVTGMQSLGGYGDPANSVQQVFVGPNLTVSEITWDSVRYESFDPSYQSEVIFSFSNSDGSEFWEFNVAAANEPGVYMGSGDVDDMLLRSGGPFQLGSDGILRLEVFEAYPDQEVLVDASITGGTFNVTAVPEPSAFLALFPAACWAYRRTRKQGAVG